MHSRARLQAASTLTASREPIHNPSAEKSVIRSLGFMMEASSASSDNCKMSHASAAPAKMAKKAVTRPALMIPASVMLLGRTGCEETPTRKLHIASPYGFQP